MLVVTLEFKALASSWEGCLVAAEAGEWLWTANAKGLRGKTSFFSKHHEGESGRVIHVAIEFLFHVHEMQNLNLGLS
jgi:hypothetical protein